MTGRTFFFPWEVTFMEWLQGAFGGKLGFLTDFFALFGEEVVLVGLIGLIYWGFNKQWGKFIATNFLAAMIISPMLKNIALRRRPYMDHPGIRCLKTVDSSAAAENIAAQGFSFPSMHASSTVSAFGSLALLIKKCWMRVVVILLLLCVGFSRVLVGVHYPTDILAGWLLGGLALLIMPALQKKIKNPLVHLAIFGLIGLPGWFYCTSSDFYTSYGLLIGITTAFWFEEKCVDFKNSRSILRAILRTVGGIVVFLACSSLLKLPFRASFLDAPVLGAHFVRVIRYAVSAFVSLGLYPMLFRCTDNFFKNGKKKACCGREGGADG